MTAATGLASSTTRESAGDPSRCRSGIASLPPPIRANPYQRLLYEQLARHGLELEPVDRFRATWLWASRRRVGRLHFHWPQSYYHDDRFGGAASWLRLGLFAGRLGVARALRYRVAWTVHQVYPHESPSRRLDRAAGRLLAAASDVLIAHDDATAAAVRRELGPRPVHVLAHPPYAGAYPPRRSREEARAALGLEGGTFAFLCFGHVRAYKGLETVLAAFAGADLADAALIIAGAPVDAAAADAVAAAAASDRRIVPLLRHVPDDRVAELHAAADAAVVARSDGGTSGGLVLALTLGVPVLGADVYADRIGAAGWTFAAGDAASLRAGLERAASDDGGAGRSAATAGAQAPRWEEIGARTAALFGKAGE